VVTDTSTGGLGETVSVSDLSPTGTFTFGGSNSATVTLTASGAGQSATSNILTTTAIAGSHTDTATATGTVSDTFGNTAHPTATDTGTYNGVGLSTPGLTIGYWYNHQSAWPDWNGGHSQPALVLGNLNVSTNSTLDPNLSADYISVPFAVASQLINSSQSANDTRQILMSQAEGAQLNIDAKAWDPGFDPHDFTYDSAHPANYGTT
jgi:hypothetical protein